MRLDVPSGQSIRFEAGDERAVDLVEFGGLRPVIGFNGLLDGLRLGHGTAARPSPRPTGSASRLDGPGRPVMSTIAARQYASLYGPTVGDRFRLADTALHCAGRAQPAASRRGGDLRRRQVAARRHGPGARPPQRRRRARPGHHLGRSSWIRCSGIVKADIGIKDGRIAGIGQAGNPYVQDGVDPDMIVGAGTEVISGEGLVATAGRHRHPRPLPHARRRSRTRCPTASPR